MSLPKADVVIADAGINGLAAALSIARQCHRVTVLEKRNSLTEVEAGIQLSPAALKALDRLDVGDAVRERIVRLDELRLVEGATGRRLATLTASLDERAGPDERGAPAAGSHAVIRRRDLFGILLEACRRHRDVHFRPGSAVAGYEQCDERVTVRLEGGEQIPCDALVGAGGACSAVRLQLDGTSHHTHGAAHVLYHAVIPAARVPDALRSNALTVWARPLWQIVCCPMDTSGVYDISAHCATRSDGVAEGLPVDLARVLGDCADAAENARALLAAADEWTMWIACDEGDPTSRWADHRVVLMGSTDRPLLPLTGHSVSQHAVEDAVRLGDLMDCDAADFPQVFLAYAAHRRERAMRALTQLFNAMYATGLYDRIMDVYRIR